MDKNSEKLLLELALHRYDEEVQRNELIDGNNKSMVAFLNQHSVYKLTFHLVLVIKYRRKVINQDIFDSLIG